MFTCKYDKNAILWSQNQGFLQYLFTFAILFYIKVLISILLLCPNPSSTTWKNLLWVQTVHNILNLSVVPYNPFMVLIFTVFVWTKFTICCILLSLERDEDSKKFNNHIEYWDKWQTLKIKEYTCWNLIHPFALKRYTDFQNASYKKITQYGKYRNTYYIIKLSYHFTSRICTAWCLKPYRSWK